MSYRFNSTMRQFEKDYSIAFGSEIKFTRDVGIVPSRNPEQPRSIPMPFGGRLFYVGTTPSTSSVSPLGISGLNYFVHWSGGIPSLVMRVNNDDASASDWLIGREGEMPVRVSGAEEMIRIVSSRPEGRRWQWGDMESISVSNLFDGFRSAASFLFFWAHFITSLLTALFFSLCFFVLHSIWRDRKLRGLRLLKTVIYAGFPAMIIAGMFPALDLPAFNYSTVYVFCLFVYWWPVSARMERELAKEERS
ncbi:MAG: hypothetical protein MJ025_00715 [Victivallaceae bacterium]|nr:hypothetical protein [Victivallaceae bacterium]